MSTILIVLAVFLSIVLFVLGIGFMFIGRKSQEKRYEKFVSSQTSEIKEPKKKSKFLSKLLKSNNTTKKERMKKSKTAKLLIHANSKLTVEEFNLMRFIALLIISTLIYFVSSQLLMVLITPILVWFLPVMFLKMKKKRRLKKFENQLGDGINMLANSLRAGYSYLQAINTVAKDMPEPIGQEFKILLKEMSLGVDSSTALDNMSEHVSSEDLSLMITAIKIQQETGGNLAEILSNISKTIRERIEIKGEIKTLTAQGRISGYVVGLLPVALILVLMVISRDYIIVLFTTEVGKGLLLYALISEMIGAYFIRKIIDIDI